MQINLRKIVDARDLHLYGGVVTLALGPILWGWSGLGVAAAGVALILLGAFGLPDWKKEKRNGPQ